MCATECACMYSFPLIHVCALVFLYPRVSTSHTYLGSLSHTFSPVFLSPLPPSLPPFLSHPLFFPSTSLCLPRPPVPPFLFCPRLCCLEKERETAQKNIEIESRARHSAEMLCSTLDASGVAAEAKCVAAEIKCAAAEVRASHLVHQIQQLQVQVFTFFSPLTYTSHTNKCPVAISP